MINQRKEFRLNGRNIGKSALEELMGLKNPGSIVNFGINKIKEDFKENQGNFSDLYYSEFGGALFNSHLNQKLGFLPDKKGFDNAIEEVWNVVNNETWSQGSALYHLYENVVRQNDNSGHDKLLPFTACAYYSAKYNSFYSDFLGYSKEIIKDEIPSWAPWSDDIGWDDNDIQANSRGVDFGERIRELFFNTIESSNSQNK